MTEPILELIDATVIVNQNTPDAKIILQGVNLTIQPGEFITLLGSNGAGKSTLFNVIAGTLPLSSGQIKIAGQDVTQMGATQRTKLLARVFQDPKVGTSPRMTGAENLLLAERRGQRRRLLNRRLTAEKQAHFVNLVNRMGNGLGTRLDMPTGALSGGQRQALSFVMATLSRPEILLLDEHTAALDPKTSQQLMRVTDEQVREQHLTALMITHNLDDALRYGNRLLILHAGQIQADYNGDEKAQLTRNQLLDYFEQY